MAPNFLCQLTGSFAMPAAENPMVAMVEACPSYLLDRVVKQPIFRSDGGDLRPWGTARHYHFPLKLTEDQENP